MVDLEDLPGDLVTLARSIDEPRRMALTDEVQRQTLLGDELAGQTNAVVALEVWEAFLQRAKDEHEV